jgi:hypothetical protein
MAEAKPFIQAVARVDTRTPQQKYSDAVRLSSRMGSQLYQQLKTFFMAQAEFVYANPDGFTAQQFFDELQRQGISGLDLCNLSAAYCGMVGQYEGTTPNPVPTGVTLGVDPNDSKHIIVTLPLGS